MLYKGRCHFDIWPPKSNQFIRESKWMFLPNLKGLWRRDVHKVKNSFVGSQPPWPLTLNNQHRISSSFCLIEHQMSWRNSLWALSRYRFHKNKKDERATWKHEAWGITTLPSHYSLKPAHLYSCNVIAPIFKETKTHRQPSAFPENFTNLRTTVLSSWWC